MVAGISEKSQNPGLSSQEIAVYNPTSVVIKDKISHFTPRPDSLDGKRIGLLWNSKPNGNVYLTRVAEMLSEYYPASQIVKFWERYPQTANPDKKSAEALDLISQHADIVITAQGD